MGIEGEGVVVAVEVDGVDTPRIEDRLLGLGLLLVGEALPGGARVPGLADFLAVLEAHHEVDRQDHLAAAPHDHLGLVPLRPSAGGRRGAPIVGPLAGPRRRQKAARRARLPAAQRVDREVERAGSMEKLIDERAQVESGAGARGGVAQHQEEVVAGRMGEAEAPYVIAQSAVQRLRADDAADRLEGDVGLAVDRVGIRARPEAPGGSDDRIVPGHRGVRLLASQETAVAHPRQVEGERAHRVADEPALDRPERRRVEPQDVVQVEPEPAEVQLQAFIQDA